MEKLRRLVAQIDSLQNTPSATSSFKVWRRDVIVALGYIFGVNTRHIADFEAIKFEETDFTLCETPQEVVEEYQGVFVMGLYEARLLLQSMMEEIKSFWNDEEADVGAGMKTVGLTATQQARAGSLDGAPRDSCTVFVVHGRNAAARDALFAFLRSIGLRPLEWSQAVAATGKASPYIGEVLDAAFSVAQAIVVLMTPDDVACLHETLRKNDDPLYETSPTAQARPNVLFEAGMAMGRNPDRTVLVEVGTLRPFSDVGGRHVVRLNDTPQKRQELAMRLKSAGCPVDLSGSDWHDAGRFCLN